ncbi:hypothetical protein Sjap_013894 [Stephania japonica]|uniref:Uncharacterized protein n=1 Tax=Stephania japonica TaxID=461633 RepID=A0AAP0J0S9_9MAGN
MKMPTSKACLFMAFMALFISMEAIHTHAKKATLDAASTRYKLLKPRDGMVQERAFCEARGRCQNKTLECPAQCPERKPKKNKKVGNPNAHNGYGSICYDPRLVGGDGVMFYFHGSTGGDYALVSDNELHNNALPS